MRRSTSFGGRRPLTFLTPEPFRRSILLDHVTIGGKTCILPTDRWVEETEHCRQLQDSRGRSYEMVEVPFAPVAQAFRQKYGEDHVARYFSRTSRAYRLDEVSPKAHDAGGALVREFDRSAETYETSVRENWIQRYMRTRSLALLRTHVVPGAKVLDLGCGLMLESATLMGHAELTGADISSAMLAKCAARFRDAPAPPRLVLVDPELRGDLGRYDVVFSTYGATGFLGMDLLGQFLQDHLVEGGLFIGSFWNRMGFFDLALSLLLGRKDYVRQRLQGRVGPGGSRYPVAVSTTTVRVVRSIPGFELVTSEGVGVVVPPYNFTGLLKRIDPERTTRLDCRLGRWTPLVGLADYLLVVLRKTDQDPGAFTPPALPCGTFSM